MNTKLSGPQYPVGIRTLDRSARSLVAVPLRYPGSRCLVIVSAHTARYERNINGPTQIYEHPTATSKL